MLIPQEQPLNRQILRENSSLKTQNKLIPTITYKQHESSGGELLKI